MGANNWRLESRLSEGRSNRCSATCFNLPFTGNTGGATPEPPADPPGICKLASGTGDVGAERVQVSSCPSITSESTCQNSYQKIGPFGIKVRCEWAITP